ncbi:hypothetical protein [Goekera deserti]|uniref:Uncharacterized protein n=1 Tax=Goekera deserti TaxID=2497753 RepID=A0A7K3WHX5_9ACTN|nr:hypothetical protein [Goekera deserti]NDI47265.1 hypothetical protein [Goekera deserti]NEL56095.1 hypothetical protein [Goekera deserti]
MSAEPASIVAARQLAEEAAVRRLAVPVRPLRRGDRQRVALLERRRAARAAR